MVKTVRKIEFNEIKEKMVLRRYSNAFDRDYIYIVQNVVRVAQVEGNLEIQLGEANSFNPPQKLNYKDYGDVHSEAPFYLVGEQTEDGTVWYVEGDDPNLVPDPNKHESYISGVVIGGEKVEIGTRLNGHEVHRIRRVNNSDFNDDVFVFHNINDAVVYETHVKDQPFSIMYGFREMGE